ncbi:MAG: hypothetical protein WBL84_12605, partial [Xanthobacteraceae bacterium]
HHRRHRASKGRVIRVRGEGRVVRRQACTAAANAIDDSNKDKLREALTLNALKQRFLERGEKAPATKVERFQNETDKPFIRISGAAAIHDDKTFDGALIGGTTAKSHFNVANLKLIVVTGSMLMTLVHALYERAADEA